jgi:hypothetical protein
MKLHEITVKHVLSELLAHLLWVAAYILLIPFAIVISILLRLEGLFWKVLTIVISLCITVILMYLAIANFSEIIQVIKMQ